MEENLDKNNELNKEISDNTTKSNSEEIKGPKSEKVINMDINNTNSATKVVIKNEINTPEKPTTKPKKELPIEKKPFLIIFFFYQSLSASSQSSSIS